MTSDAGLDVLALHALIADRRSVKEFDPHHQISSAAVRHLLAAANWAPSAGNSQPWAFAVLRRDSPKHARFTRLLAPNNVTWVPAASLVVLAFSRTSSGPDADAMPYSDYADFDAGQAVAQLALQARAEGFETHQFAGFKHAAASSLVSAPPHYKPLVGIAIGVAADAQPAGTHAGVVAHEAAGRRTRDPITLFE